MWVHLLDQPAQYLVGPTAKLQERQAGEAHDNEEAVERYTTLSAVAENLRCTAFEC
jgi:hypothetical protein